MGERTEQLRQSLGGPALARVRQRIADHLAGGGDPDGVVTLAAPTDEERRAVAALLGRTPSLAARLAVPLHELSARLRAAGIADGVRDAIELLDGPVPAVAAARGSLRTAWAEVALAASVLDERLPHLRGWAGGVAASGRLRRAAGSEPAAALRLLAAVEAVLRRVPAEGGIRRSRLANEALGSAHALDAGTPLAGLLVDAVRSLVGPPLLEGAEGERETWAAVGVLADALTSRVCALNLPAVGDGPADAVVRSARGEPVWLSLRTLVRHPPRLAGGRVHACENLSVVEEAADALGDGCAPLVCVGGNPVVAVLRLLDAAAASGCDVVYHGDFDWPGLAIAGRVLRRLGPAGRPWRFGADDYRAAVERRVGGLAPLRGTPTASPWAPGVAAALHHHGVAVEEEAVVADLLEDLAG